MIGHGEPRQVYVRSKRVSAASLNILFRIEKDAVVIPLLSPRKGAPSPRQSPAIFPHSPADTTHRALRPEDSSLLLPLLITLLLIIADLSINRLRLRLLPRIREERIILRLVGVLQQCLARVLVA